MNKRKQERNRPLIWGKRCFALGLLFSLPKNRFDKYLQPFFNDCIKLTFLCNAPRGLLALTYKMIKLIGGAELGMVVGYGAGLVNEQRKKRIYDLHQPTTQTANQQIQKLRVTKNSR